MRRLPKPRNPVARALRDPRNKARVVQDKRRKPPKHKSGVSPDSVRGVR